VSGRIEDIISLRGVGSKSIRKSSSALVTVAVCGLASGAPEVAEKGIEACVLMVVGGGF
jgi:hypothetical protein